MYPGIAVARELLAHTPSAQVAFVGTAAGIEARVIPREGFALELIHAAGLKGKSLGALVRGITLLPLGARDAWRVITRRRPSVVVGVGGYSSGPVVLLAALRGVPTLLMEQNAMPGLANRSLARMVDAAAVTYEESRTFFGSKAFVSGNPVRTEFFDDSPLVGGMGGHDDDVWAPPGAARVLVFGGSQGAHAINVAMVAAASRLGGGATRVAITHQTGERDLEMVRDGYRRAGIASRVEPFLYAMAREMKRADLVICRAGATTLAELMAAGRASILVPLPTATDDHQRKNALALVSVGAARMIEQRDLSGDRLAADIIALAGDAVARQRIATAARAMARPQAAHLIVDRILQLAGAA